MATDKKLKAMDICAGIVASISKSCKDGSVITSDSIRNSKIKYQSSGIFAIDEAISKGRGIPKGKLIEVFGPESCGKSHFLYSVCKQVQSRGKIAIIADIENRCSSEYLIDEIGLDPDLLIVIKNQTCNDLFDSMIKDGYLNNPNVGVVGLDSIAAVLTDQEMKGEVSDANIGAQARLVTRFINRATKVQTNEDAPSIIAVNQLRDNVGALYGPDYKVPGGRALKFLGSVRIKMKRIEKLEGKDGKPIGQEVDFEMVKNSVGTPNTNTEVKLLFGKGYSNLQVFLDMFFKGKRKFEFQLTEKQYNFDSKDEFENWLYSKPKLAEKLWNQLRFADQKQESLPSVDADASTEQLSKEEEEIPL